ncbi:MAG: glycosyltransferase [Pseudomonadota bacterium]|nr:glycosyltransferase [Pseudomonadota bacterium]
MAKTGTLDTRRLRIGFFIPWITKGRGGTENVGQMMANAMQARGHQAVIFTFDDAKGASLWPLSDEIELVHLSEAADEPADGQMALEVAARNLDLLVGLHMNATFTRYVRCAWKTGLPIVLSEHIDPRFPDWIGAFPADERQATFSGATLIHILVEAFRDTFHEDFRDKVRVVPNTIREPVELADLAADKTERTILTVSRLVPRKNVDRLIEAFAQVAREFPDWTLRIVGDGAARPPLAKLAKTLGVGRRVTFVGEMSDPYPEYQRADLFVTPSLFEGFGLTLCEANAHGVPGIGYAACNGINEQIVPGENGLLSRGGEDLGTLAADMRTLMADDALRQKMGARARELFLERYANAVVEDGWERVFLEAAAMDEARAKPTQAEIRAVRLWETVHGPLHVETPKAGKY